MPKKRPRHQQPLIPPAKPPAGGKRFLLETPTVAPVVEFCTDVSVAKGPDGCRWVTFEQNGSAYLRVVIPAQAWTDHFRLVADQFKRDVEARKLSYVTKEVGTGTVDLYRAPLAVTANVTRMSRVNDEAIISFFYITPHDYYERSRDSAYTVTFHPVASVPMAIGTLMGLMDSVISNEEH